VEVYLDFVICPERCSQGLVHYLHVKFCYIHVAVQETTSLFVPDDSVLSGSIYLTPSIAL
jgi:hypothetical protein